MYWLLKRGLSAAAGEAAEGEQQEEEEEGSHGELGSSDRTSDRTRFLESVSHDHAVLEGLGEEEEVAQQPASRLAT